jgi:hypothetical protein
MANYDTPQGNPEPAEASAVADSTVRPFAYASVSTVPSGVTLNKLLQQTVQEIAADANVEMRHPSRRWSSLLPGPDRRWPNRQRSC